MRRLLAIFALVSVLAGALVAASAAKGPPPPPFPNLPGVWSHAEINVRIRGVPHTLILDRGRIVQVTDSQITLREFDGSIVPIDLSPTTTIAFRGFGYRARFLRRGLFALTMRIDDGPAVRVRVTLRR